MDTCERYGAFQRRTYNGAFGTLSGHRSGAWDEDVAVKCSPFVPCVHDIANGETVRMFYLEELGILDATVFRPLDGLGLLASATRE